VNGEAGLERETGAELAATRSDRGAASGLAGSDVAEIADASGIVGIRGAIRWTRVEVVIGSLEARMIEGVDEISPQFQTKAFPEVETLGQGQVHDGQAGAAKIVAAKGAEGAGSRVCKGIGIDVSASGNVRERIADFVEIPDAIVGALGTTAIAAVPDGERIAALDNESAGETPTANQSIFHGAAMEILFIAAKRQLIGSEAFQGVRDIKIGIAVVQLGIVADLPRLIATAATPSRRVLIIQEVGPDIVGLQGQTIGVALGERGLQRVVVGNGVVHIAFDISEQRERPVGLDRGASRLLP